MANNLVETFATALLELASGRPDVELLLGNALVTRELFGEYPTLEKILASHMIDDADKHKVIDAVFAPITCHNYCNFLHVVVVKNDFPFFEQINDEFIKLATHEIDAKDAYVYSVRPVPSDDLEKIKGFLEKKYSVKIFTHNIIDTTLIGGLRVVMEDITFDNSVSFQINRLRERILAETR